MPSRFPQLLNLRRIFIVISSLLLTGVTQQVLAEKLATEQWDISADKVVRYENPSSIVAKGNVILEKKERIPAARHTAAAKTTEWAELLEEATPVKEITADEISDATEPRYKTTVTIRADWIVYDIELESIKAKGNVQIITDEDKLFAEEGNIKLGSETGKFTNATILRKKNSLHLEGKSIEKTGFDTYRIKDGWVITCKLENNEAPPWSFSSSEADVRQNGYAFLKHAKFNIRNIPVFYTPYLVIPVKNTRQTGFLFPEFSQSSNGGFGFNLPFFLNISESMDATFFPQYHVKRGFMPGIEFRYVEKASDKGLFSANYLHDRLSDPSETQYYQDTGFTHTNKDRYWIRGKADHTFANVWQSRLDIDVVSDQDYLTEFKSGVTGFKKNHNQYLKTFGRGFQNETDKFRQNSLKILRSWNGMSLETNFLAINEADKNASNTNTPLWKLPSVDFSGAVPLSDSSFTLDWDADYVNYWREDGIGGHRVDLHPTLATSVPLSPYLESRAEVGLRDTFYYVKSYGDSEWDKDDTQNRFLLEFETEVATTLEKNFFHDDSGRRSGAHQVRPFIRYGYIQDIDQKDLPQFDKVDTIGEKNSISYGIDNFFNTFTYNKSGMEKLREYAYLKLQQSYDLRDEASDEPFSDIYTKLGWKPFKRADIYYRSFYDVYDNRFNSHTFEGDYTNSRGDSFGLDYSYKPSSDIEQVNGRIQARILANWIAGGEVKYSIAHEETDEATASLTYQALCWSVKFETKYTPADTTYLVLFKLANIGGIGIK